MRLSLAEAGIDLLPHFADPYVLLRYLYPESYHPEGKGLSRLLSCGNRTLVLRMLPDVLPLNYSLPAIHLIHHLPAGDGIGCHPEVIRNLITRGSKGNRTLPISVQGRFASLGTCAPKGIQSRTEWMLGSSPCCTYSSRPRQTVIAWSQRESNSSHRSCKDQSPALVHVTPFAVVYPSVTRTPLATAGRRGQS